MFIRSIKAPIGEKPVPHCGSDRAQFSCHRKKTLTLLGSRKEDLDLFLFVRNIARKFSSRRAGKIARRFALTMSPVHKNRLNIFDQDIILRMISNPTAN